MVIWNHRAGFCQEEKMTRADELKEIMQEVVSRNYTRDEFQLFKDEYGWKDWMNDYTNAAEDGEISESESREIDKILEEGFKMAFDSQCREIYGI